MMVSASTFVAHTGWWWLDVLVYVVSGSAFLGICYLLPQYYRESVKPIYDDLREEIRARRESRKQNQ